jgi:hypothetical protein
VQVDLQALLGASVDDIRAFATAFITTGNASTEAQIAVLNAATALAGLRDSATSADAVLSQREQFERRILELQGNTAEIQRRDLLAVQDDYNRGLLEQIFAYENASRAAQTFSSSLQGFFNTPDLQSLRGNTRRLATDSSGTFFEFDLNDFNQQRGLLTEADIPGIVARYDQSTQDRVNSLLTGNPFFPSMFLDQVARTRVAIPDTRNDAARQAEQDRMAANAASAPEDPLLRAQRENTEAIKRLTGSLSDYLDSLNTSDILGLSPEEQQRNALAAFNSSLNLARGGDTAALERLQADTQRAIETTRGAFGSGSEGSALLQAIVAAVRELQEGLGQGISRVADAAEGGLVVTSRGLSAVETATRGTTAAVAQRTAADTLAAQRLVGFDA